MTSLQLQAFALSILILSIPTISVSGVEEGVSEPRVEDVDVDVDGGVQDDSFTDQDDHHSQLPPPPPPPPPPVRVHYAISPIHLTYLAKVEKNLIQILGRYEEILAARLDNIRRYRIDYEASVFPALSTLEAATGRNSPEFETEDESWARGTFLSSHPLFLYRMMARYANTLAEIVEDLSRNWEGEVLLHLDELRGGVAWPGQEDLEDVARAIFRLQDVYGLHPSEFSEGVISGIQTSVGLTAAQSLDLAETGLSLGDSLTAGEWLQAARGKIRSQVGDESLHSDDLIQPWEQAVRLHGKTWNIDDFGVDDIFSASRSLVDAEYQEMKWNLSWVNRIQNFKALCRGESPPLRRVPPPPGRCFLLGEIPRDGFIFRINPLKIEVHSMDPPILQFHSFFGEGLIGEMSHSVFHPLMRAAEHGSEGKETNFLLSKTTARAWIWERVPGLEAAFHRLEKVLGHPISGRENEGVEEPTFYMQSFSVGNYYEPCLECEEDIPEILEKVGKRIATAEFILDETEAGGETVFPQLGLRIRAAKGSILVFLDDGNTSQDFRRLRATCPVLLGQKWVASKFIYERGQCLKPNVVRDTAKPFKEDGFTFF